MASQNITARLEAKIDAQNAKIDAMGAKYTVFDLGDWLCGLNYLSGNYNSGTRLTSDQSTELTELVSYYYFWALLLFWDPVRCIEWLKECLLHGLHTCPRHVEVLIQFLHRGLMGRRLDIYGCFFRGSRLVISCLFLLVSSSLLICVLSVKISLLNSIHCSQSVPCILIACLP